MIYFDNGATTFPKPTSVINAVNNTLRSYGANPGRSGHRMSLKASEIMYDCRKNVARLFNLNKPENIVFTNNCTTALNYVIKGVLKKGDHCIISSLEHNAVYRPVTALKKLGISYTVADFVPYDEESTINNFRNAIRDNTKLVVCIHASNVFGVKLPVERIAALCKIYGIMFCVDAAQTAGVVPIFLDESYIDFLCTAGHKSLYGPMGTGILAINTDKQIDCIIQGGTGTQSLSSEQPQTLPDKFESGTPNLSGVAGLNEGVKFVLNKGVKAIEKKEMFLAQRLYDNLSNIKGVELYTKRPTIETSVPVISFNLRGFDCEETASMLDKRNIAVRAGLHCAPLAHQFFGTEETGTVRAVVSFFTDNRQIDYFSKCIMEINKYKK